jgi:hypothetical protein
MLGVHAAIRITSLSVTDRIKQPASSLISLRQKKAVVTGCACARGLPPDLFVTDHIKNNLYVIYKI